MNTRFTYSLLQYKHSLVLGEAINVGILFYFPEQRFIEFASGNSQRAKSIYPDFDNNLFNHYLQLIEQKIKSRVDLFNSSEITEEFGNYIHNHILSQDAAGLIFNKPVELSISDVTTSDIVKQYSQLLLPGINATRPHVTKHNEQFIIKKFTNYIFSEHKELEDRVTKNEWVKTKHLKLKFELGWQGKVKHLVKPLSFDLADTQSIQTKAATFLGYLTQFEDYAKNYNTRFDFLIAKPQNSTLKRDYENALDLLDWAKKTPKELITEDKWDGYSQQTISSLLLA